MKKKGLLSLLTQKIYLSLIGVIVIFVVFASYLVAAVLDTPLTSRPKQVTVEMDYTGGLFDGSAVTYRGVKIGKVTEVELNDEGLVEATVSLVTTKRIPKSSVVKIRSLSPVGEQYVDFQPRSEDGPYLEDGDRIPASATQLPETLGATVVNIKALLDQIDAKNVKTALSEIAIGLEGTGDGLGRLVDQGDVLLADIEKNWPLTQRLLRNGNTVLRIAPSLESEIGTIATSSEQVAAFLKQFDPTFQKLLSGAPRQMRQLEALLKDAEEILPALLDQSIALNDVLAAREPHVRALLQAYGPGVGGLANTFVDGELKLSALIAGQRICEYGTSRRSPTEARRELQTGGRCAASFGGLQRGAAHTPAPLW